MKHRMSRLQRAKQFMPFAALKGFEVLLAAVARPKENRVELSGMAWSAEALPVPPMSSGWVSAPQSSS